MFVIPGLTRNPVFENWFPAFAGTTSGFLVEFIPLKNGAGMARPVLINEGI
jgi:hypothetical protein